MKLVHVGTLVTSTFGVLDENGNVIVGEEPVIVKVTRLNQSAFLEALALIEEKRNEAEHDGGQR